MNVSEKINEVYLELIKMFDLTLSYLDDALSFFKEENTFETKEKEINDDLVDLKLINIEKDCLNIILRERPFANDLRKITGIFKMVDDIERLADHSEDISWCIDNLKNVYDSRLENESFKEMIDVAFNMVKFSYEALIKNDDMLAQKVLKMDDKVDTLYLEVLNELRTLKEKEKENTFVIYMTLLAKYIERIADHASNISEWVIYIDTGFYKSDVIF